MTKRIATIDLKGKAYATVPTRIKEFREANPNGLIETKPTIDGQQVIFSARVLKDKSNISSGEATGHSIGKMGNDKAFEKLETIAIGRALAILGYMASGEIASSEEMEEFENYKLQKKAEQVAETIAKMKEATTLSELKQIVISSPVGADSDVQTVKEELKLKLK